MPKAAKRLNHPKTLKFSCKICLQVLHKRFWAQFHDLCVQKRSGFLYSWDAFWISSDLWGLWKKFWTHFLDFFVQKRSSLPLRSDAFRKFSPCKLYKKSCGCIFPILASKTKRFAVKFRRILEVLYLQDLQKSSGRKFTIYVSKNQAVCCEVQTHFWSFRLARFTENVLSAFSRFVRPKTKLFAVKFRRILEVLCLQVLQKTFWA